MNNEPLSEAEFNALVEETERKMLGLLPPGSLEDFKGAPDGEVDRAVRPSDKAIRAFILTRGRSPSVDELRKMMR